MTWIKWGLLYLLAAAIISTLSMIFGPLLLRRWRAPAQPDENVQHHVLPSPIEEFRTTVARHRAAKKSVKKTSTKGRHHA